MALFFLYIFRTLNADIASRLFVPDTKQSLLDLAAASTKMTAVSDMHTLLLALSQQIDTGVLYILDEHNELYRMVSSGVGTASTTPLARHPDFLGRFTGWTDVTAGVSIFVAF